MKTLQLLVDTRTWLRAMACVHSQPLRYCIRATVTMSHEGTDLVIREDYAAALVSALDGREEFTDLVRDLRRAKTARPGTAVGGGR